MTGFDVDPEMERQRDEDNRFPLPCKGSIPSDAKAPSAMTEEAVARWLYAVAQAAHPRKTPGLHQTTWDNLIEDGKVQTRGTARALIAWIRAQRADLMDALRLTACEATMAVLPDSIDIYRAFARDGDGYGGWRITLNGKGLPPEHDNFDLVYKDFEQAYDAARALVAKMKGGAA